MSTLALSRRSSRFSILFTILSLLLFAAPAAAGGGNNVLPSTAQPKGYSLAEAAAATAFFNTGTRSEAELPGDFPFQILYTSGDATTNTFNVKPGTAFYIPIVHDESLQDVSDPQAVRDLYFDGAQYGAEYVNIIVDGKVTAVGPEYAVGVATPGLRPGIDAYTAIAVFHTPLPRGRHTVTIEARFTGDLLGPDGVYEFQSTYEVNVG